MVPPLKVLFATPEAVPFAKTGGLADVSGMLPRVLAQMGLAVKVIMPCYRMIPPELLRSAVSDVSFSVTVDGNTHPLTIRRL
jgi:starch synthase